MTYLMAAILGVVQGIAEFLPISSSGHLTLLQHFFGMEEVDNLFNVLLHFATLIAVCIVYRQDIIDMIQEFFCFIGSIFSKEAKREAIPPARRLMLLIIVGTLPLFVFVPFMDQLEALGSSPVFVSCALLVTGCLLFLSDRAAKGKKNVKSVTIKDVVLVGVAQGVATLPGLSRSGCTISAAMALGFDRNFAVRYSFLLSLPAVMGATLLKVIDVAGTQFNTELLPKYLLGMVIAGVVGYFAINLVKLLTSKGKFGAFAWYCWAAGAVSLVALAVQAALAV